MKNKKKMFANSNYMGGILYNKNAFTLIELLAIIVILAIIAVITIPIILNIVENSRKGTATDSAYGYKDSVNKYYIQELQTSNKLKLDGTYTVNSDGSLTPGNAQTNFGDDRESLDVSVSGTKPSSGTLTYSNNVLTEGCLVIGDYAVTFNGNSTSTVKGICRPAKLTMDEMCPGCVFGVISGVIGDALHEPYSNRYYQDYTIFNAHFVGVILEEGKVSKAFACAKEGDDYFCLEGYDTSKYDRNKEILDSIYSNCEEENSSTGLYMCTGSTKQAHIRFDGQVGVYNFVDEHSWNIYEIRVQADKAFGPV